MKTLQLVSYSATAPGATGAAGAAVSGDSLVIAFGTGKPAHIVAWWADNQSAGFHQLTFPSGHDTTRGLRLRVRASELLPLLPRGCPLEVQAGETMTLLVAGSATAGDVESGSFLIAYDDLPGITGRGIDWPTFLKRRDKLVSVDLTVTGAAAGYTGSIALNNASDLLLPNRDYAIMGAISDSETCAVSIIGPDTGNLRIGCPASDAEQDETNEFFLALARENNAPLIPVINSGNKANTLVSILQDENNITPKISILLALLQ